MKKRLRVRSSFVPVTLMAFGLISATVILAFLSGAVVTHRGEEIVGPVQSSFDSEKLQGLSADEIINESGWRVEGNNLISKVTGNIGIGVSNPSKKLEVAGDVSLSNGGRIIGLRAESVSAIPASGQSGSIVFNSADKKLYMHDGTLWKNLAGSVALVGPLNGDGLSIPPEAYQVMCMIGSPGTGGWDLTPYNEIRYNGQLKLTVVGWTGNKYNTVQQPAQLFATWDAAGGGTVTIQGYSISGTICDGTWPPCRQGYVPMYNTCCIPAGTRFNYSSFYTSNSATCYYTKLG